jgi:hypothetical protein
LGDLSATGAIAPHRGRVAILSRNILDSAACECYRPVRIEFKRLLS